MTGRAVRVLVAEDDETLRETVVELLADEGHEVRGAANGHDALLAIENWTPDIAILDVMMPVKDAYAFREEQRRRPEASATSIVVISAGANVEEAAEQLEADAWLVKPFGLDELLGLVDRLRPAATHGAEPAPS